VLDGAAGDVISQVGKQFGAGLASSVSGEQTGKGDRAGQL
jgi:hypothetical protein